MLARGEAMRGFHARHVDGRCAACGEIIVRASGVRGRKPVVCRAPECVRAYHLAYGVDRRERERREVCDRCGISVSKCRQLKMHQDRYRRSVCGFERKKEPSAAVRSFVGYR